VASELPPVDGVLLALVRATNSIKDIVSDEDIGLGLVLTVGGTTISGILIPNWLWFKKVEENLRKDTPPQGNKSNDLADIFDYFSSEMIAMREDSAKISSLFNELPENAKKAIAESDRTEFIHLKNARVYDPGYPGIPANGMLWRGRVREISGWSLGLFEAQQ
jgi:hypothetical protein